MASLLRFAYVMALRRAITGWRMEAVLFGSIILAVALMASGVIFSELLSNAALRGALVQAEAEDVNFRIRTFSSRDDPPGIEQRREAFREREELVRQRVAAPFEEYLVEYTGYLETATFFFQGRPNLELHKDHRPRGPFVSLSGLSGRIQVVEGRWPEGHAGPGQPVDVAVDRLGAELLTLAVGEEIEAFPATSFTDSAPVKVRISAIFEVLDPADEFWYGLSYAFSRQDDRWTLIPLFTDERSMMEGVLGAYPGLYTDTTWHFFTDRQKMRAAEVEEVQNILAGIRQAVSVDLKNSSYSIRLDGLLDDYEEQLLLARLPLYLMLFLVTGILVYYLALIAGLVVRSRGGEIAMLKSRGATSWQLGLLGLGEGLLLAVPAVIAGPFVALGVVKLLGFIFFELSGASEALAGVPAGISAASYLLGLAGGGLAVLVFTLATLAAARRSGVEARQSGARPPTTNVLHRYYLDVALLALIGLLWWQLQNQGTFLVQSLGSRELSINYTLLLGPVLGLMAAGLIVLRVFPWATALLAQLAGPVGPSWLVHVLRHLSRDPMTPAMLIVLVMLATALGVMGSAFSSTLERGQRERALYEAGADLRLLHGGVNRPEIASASRNRSGPVGGAQFAAEVFRTPGYLTTTGFSTSGILLAVDARSIADVAWFREDFADHQSIEELSRIMLRGPTGTVPEPDQDGIVIPEETETLNLWARSGGSAQGVGVWVRLRGSEGRVVDEWMDDLRNTEWSLLELDLKPDEPQGTTRRFETHVSELKAPLEIISFSVRNRFSENSGGAIFLGRIEAVTPQETTVVQDFSTTEGWQVIEDFRRPGLYSLETTPAAAEGEFGVTSRFSWAPGGTGRVGLRTGGPDMPIPALVSSQFLEVADAEVGDVINVSMSSYSISVQASGELKYFPTLDPADRPFAIVDLSRFSQAGLRYSPLPPRKPNELWLSGGEVPLEDGRVTAALRDEGVTVRNVISASDLVTRRVEQPLVSAGWGALLVLLFIAVALASASGLLLFSHLDARERQTEFALLRTLGISRGQMQRIVWVNLLLIVVSGVALGSLLGWLIGASLLPLMEVVEEGGRATPSLVFTADWNRLLVSYFILAVVAALCGLWVTWLMQKLQLQQVLRMGE